MHKSLNSFVLCTKKGRIVLQNPEYYIYRFHVSGVPLKIIHDATQSFLSSSKPVQMIVVSLMVRFHVNL